jgi:hypothetical protein
MPSIYSSDFYFLSFAHGLGIMNDRRKYDLAAISSESIYSWP